MSDDTSPQGTPSGQGAPPPPPSSTPPPPAPSVPQCSPYGPARAIPTRAPPTGQQCRERDAVNSTASARSIPRLPLWIAAVATLLLLGRPLEGSTVGRVLTER